MIDSMLETMDARRVNSVRACHLRNAFLDEKNQHTLSG